MSNIKVAVRCRPLFENERPAAGLEFHQSRRILLDNKTYDPDFIFPPTATQDDVFTVCQPILQSVKDGLNGTVMVYGQTGTGKTHTMLGAAGETSGIAHRMIAHMLEHVQQKTLEGSQCALTLSMIEIYNERLTDMLSENGDTEVTLVGGFPKSMEKLTLSRLSDANEAIQRGLSWRHTAVTLMNERSSRSHVVFILDLEEQNDYTETVDVAHLFMVDLAGSESLKKSQVSGMAANEAGKINKSLLALKSVFLALANSSESTRPNHVPYRDSKLTELLRDSVGGTARTLMIACISAVGRDIEETKSTLMYAVKARSIRNVANTEREKLMVRLRSFEVENQRLRNRLQERVVERGGYYISREEHERFQQLEEEHQTIKTDLEDLLRERQQTEAQHHISASQRSILQAMVEEKEEELRGFKQTYHEALLRFDSQVIVLQRVVQEAVRSAQEAVQRGVETTAHQLDEWRTHTLREKIKKENTQEKEKGVEEEKEEEVVELEEKEKEEEEEEGALVFTCEYEAEVARLVSRINNGFVNIMQQMQTMAQQHCATVHTLQERRRSSLDTMQRRLQEQVQELLTAYTNEQISMDRELEEEQKLFTSQITAATMQPPPANALPFKHVVRNVCRAAVESSDHSLPPLEVASEVMESLHQINEAFRVKATSSSLGALLMMGNMPPPRDSNSSLATNTTTNSTATATNHSTVTPAANSATATPAGSPPLPLSSRDKNYSTTTTTTTGAGGSKVKRIRSGSALSDSRRASARCEK
ncbi:Unc104-like kinesin [Trypanosoma theileri]|uniref:Kinesin-like protein n=1 Tax=Trypanosoma theileri TaxID=67003 RepID=A0A1X0NY69_9TRYP|nr:Unc104-like kinesin [Trypanosoma theileri]ORC89617.1 Unc104-like kinesin [Trypanosoma theileri]